MILSDVFISELNQEAAKTKKLLSRVPDGRFDWKPHEKSMAIGRLATHIAELPGWISMVVDKEELDFATREYAPRIVNNNEELVALLDENINSAATALQGVSNEDLAKTWRLRNGDHIIMTMPKADVIRVLAMNHLIHHRGQLTVYLRQNDVPLPNMYGPTADEA
jgi:uncharacterized damage-inducible protein DinB